ncbi:MAG: hypothetical protein MK066_07910 [Crocinitomicaceae bacterium]|nr:hypothetical protein [Crocinitomicaceae bacterium]
MQTNHQAYIFEIIKRKINGEDSLGNVVGDILSISQDAVYRRYRGETLLTIYELEKLTKHFSISLDSLFDIEDHKVIFDFQPLDQFDFSMVAYLNNLRDGFRYVKQQANPHLTLSINNTHLLQLMNFPHLVRFKLFFWAKTHIQIKEYEDRKFKYEKVTEEAYTYGWEILRTYCSIPSRELFDPELIAGFAREIQYYFNAHLFEDRSYAIYLLKQLAEFTNHLKAQAEVGKKFVYNTQPPANGNEYEVYFNETLNGFGTIYYKSDDSDGLYIAHNILNTLHTTNRAYIDDSLQILDRQFANASIISQTNEKARNAYFHKLERSVLNIIKKLELELEEELM